ncbi:MAG: hypothetical protein EP318_11795 [Rhodobacteraceae bacterium]|nr:MAG: hypothetical protein EP318_11795 [Paracoccaceae bacterium]
MSKSNDPKSKETEDKEKAEQEPVEQPGPETPPEGDDGSLAGIDPVETGIKTAPEHDPRRGELLTGAAPDDRLSADVASDDGMRADVASDDGMRADETPDDTSDVVEIETSDPEADPTIGGPDETGDVPTPDAAPAFGATSAARPPEKVVERVVERKGGFWPMAFGGILAAGLGFGAAWYLAQDDSFETETRAALDRHGSTLEDLAGRTAALSDADTATAARLDELTAGLEATQADLATAQDGLSALGTRLDGVDQGFDARITEIDERLTELIKRPVADNVSREAIKAYEDELERLRGSMEEQRKAIEDTIAAEKAKIEKIAAEATQFEERALEQSRLAAARSAMARVLSALDTGEAFEAALAELAQNVDDPLEALRAVAAEGVVTQAALRERFPDASRDALRAVRSSAPDDGGGGIGGVLERMFEVRSVEPREGDDADAVLSRAEAAVRAGDIRAALAEIDALPEVAKEVLSDWVTDAETRISALEEAQAVAARLNEG